MAKGRAKCPIASTTLALVPSLAPATMRGHLMPSFTNSLIELGPFVDTGHTVVFTATGVSVIHPDGHSILDGWREVAGPRLWRFPLTPTQEKPVEVLKTRSVAFVLPNDHVDKDSLLWQKVATKKGISGAVLPVQERTQECSPEQLTTTPTGDKYIPTTKGGPRKPSKNGQVHFHQNVDKYISTQKSKSKPKRRRPTMPLVTEPVTPPLPATTPPAPNVSDQHFKAVGNHGQA